MYSPTNFPLHEGKDRAFYAFILICILYVSTNTTQASSFNQNTNHTEEIFLSTNDEFDNFSLTEFPQNLQLYARDTTTNRAVVEVTGKVGVQGDSVSLIVLRDSVPFARYGAKPDDSAAFAFYPEIYAELSQYTFELYEITTSGTTLRASATDVVAGDVYIINGQSNAEAQMFDGSSAPDSSPFIRVYGSGTSNYTVAQNDTLWYIGQGDEDRFSKGNTGQWGLYFAKQIIDNQGIPVCIFNGGHGGQRVQVFRRYDDNPEFNNNYGRLLSRLNRTGLADKVRAILWYQGEEDVIVTTPTNYKQYFTDVYDDWTVDYPSVEQVYLAEIRTGCFAEPHEAVLIQNVLRQLANELPHTNIVSTKGLEQDGPCHFKYEGGYKELGRRFYRLVERDIYGGSTTAVVESPNISTAAFTAYDEITLTVQAADTLIWEAGSKNDFVLEGDSLTSVVSGYTVGNTIILQLSGDSTTATGITYLDKSGEGVTSPFVTNNEGYGMIGFYNFPIEPLICAEIDLKVYLQGTYQVHIDTMSNRLYQRGLLPGQNPINSETTRTPVGQPYHLSPWNYGGTEGTNWADNDYRDNTVDWLLVSFRTDISADSEIKQTAALLLNNGEIDFPDRCVLSSSVADSLYILIEHRNHMGIMSPTPVLLIDNTLTHDFTLNDSYQDGTGYGQINMGGKWAMFAADADQNDIHSYDINGSDKAIWDRDNGTFDRYLSCDFNLDGDVSGADKLIWKENNGISSRVPK